MQYVLRLQVQSIASGYERRHVRAGTEFASRRNRYTRIILVGEIHEQGSAQVPECCGRPLEHVELIAHLDGQSFQFVDAARLGEREGAPLLSLAIALEPLFFSRVIRMRRSDLLTASLDLDLPALCRDGGQQMIGEHSFLLDYLDD